MPATATLTATVTDDGQVLPTPTLTWSQVSGPGTATFTAPTALTTSVSFSAAGTYVLRLSVYDGALTGSDDVTITVEPPANVAPIVNVGPGRFVTLPATVTLTATVTDDGKVLATPTLEWTQVSGPGIATFTPANALTTTVSFSVAGTYVLRLTANDGALVGTSDLSVIVSPKPNVAPVITSTPVTAAVARAAYSYTVTATDGDGDTLTFALVAAPPGMKINDATGVIAWVPADDQVGDATVTVRAHDGVVDSAPQTFVIHVLPVNQPPQVSVAAAAPVTLPTPASLDASATDDGQQHALTVQWSKVDGPGTAAFSAPDALDTLATFGQPGTYTLRVTVDDGEFRPFADVTVTASAPVSDNQPPQVDAGPDQGVTLPSTVSLNGSVSDDGKPGGSALDVTWSKASGPGAVTFGDAKNPVTTAAFSDAGSYVLYLTATDGQFLSADEVSITVQAAAPTGDRAPPVVTIQAPAEVLPGTQVDVTASAVDNDRVEMLRLEIEGQAPEEVGTASLTRSLDVPAFARPGQSIRIAATAMDASGNVGQAEKVLTITVTPDTTSPVVQAWGPATAAPGQAIRLVAEATDNIGVAWVVFLLDGVDVATSAAPPYTAAGLVPADASVGSTLTFVARALDFAGNASESTGSIDVVSSLDTAPPTVSLTTVADVYPGERLTLSATSRDTGGTHEGDGIATVSFSVDGTPLAVVLAAPYSAEFMVPATAVAGTVFNVATTATDFAGLTASDTKQVRVLARPVTVESLVLGEVYDDATGLPIAGATVRLTGTAAQGLSGSSTSATTDALGRYVVRANPGTGLVRITKDNWTTADRLVTVDAGQAVEAFDARLTRFGAASQSVSEVLGGTVESDGARLVVPAGALAQATALRVVAVSQQGLQGLLPLGWSPRGVVDVEPHGAAFGDGTTLSVANAFEIPAGTPLVLARWDDDATAWRAAGAGAVSADGTRVEAPIVAGGQYAWLVADVVPVAPPMPIAGELVAGVAASPIPDPVTTAIAPQPQVVFYKPGVHSDVRGVITATGPASSGGQVWAHLAETYRFFSGSEITPEAFVQDLVMFQVHGTPDALAASFVVSPSLAFEALSLERGVIGVGLYVPPAQATPPTVVAASGGVVNGPSGESLVVLPGSLGGATAIALASLPADQVGIALPAGAAFAGAVQVGFSGALQRGGLLSMTKPDDITEGDTLLLTRLAEIAGRTRFVLVALARASGNSVVSETTFEGQPTALDGVRVPGRYVFLRIAAPLGYAAGVVRGVDDAPFAGALVTNSALDVVSLSAPTGGYFVAAPAGPVTLTALDVVKNDFGTSPSFLTAGVALPVGLRIVAQLPRVISVSPADGAASVALSDPVIVVFSKPIDPASFAGANQANLTVAGPDGVRLEGAAAMSAANTVLTFRPATDLAVNTHYTVTISSDVVDAAGYRLGTAFTSGFDSLDTVPPPVPPAGAISASVPGSNGQAAVRATQGTVSPNDTVYVHNLTSGVVIPVPRALYQANGSFEFAVPVLITDKLRLRIVDIAGNETIVDLERFQQTNPDGTVSAAVDNAGGVVEGSGGVQADVPEGAFPDGAVVTVGEVPLPDPDSATDEDKVNYELRSALEVDFGGAVPAKYVNVSIPAAAAETADTVWLVAQVVDYRGQQVLNIVDTAKLKYGRIETSSPPFPGVSNSGTYVIVTTRGPQGISHGRVVPAESGVNMRFALMTLNPTYLNVLSQLPFFAGTDEPRRMGFPMPAGRVNLSENRVRLHVDANVVAPAHRELLVRDLDTEQSQSYPLLPLDYRVQVPGSVTDGFDVTVKGPGSRVTPVTSVRVMSGAPDTVTIRLNPDAIAVPVTHVIVMNRITHTEHTFAFPTPAVNVGVPGGVATSREVWLVDAAGGKQLLNVASYQVTPSSDGPGNLLLRIQPGALSGAGGVVKVEILGAAGSVREVVPFELNAETRFVFDGDAGDSYILRATLADGRLHHVPIPRFQITVRNPLTDEVVRTISGFVPPADEPLDLGHITDDVSSPFVVAGPAGISSFDPSGTITFTFSEPMDADSLKEHITVHDSAGQRVAGEVRVSAGNRVATFVPAVPLRMGEKYRVTVDGALPLTPEERANGVLKPAVRDGGGNPIAPIQLTLSVFTPKSIGSLAGAAPFKDVAIRRKRTNQVSTTTLFVTTGGMAENLLAIDVTNPRAPAVVGAASGAMSQQRVAVIPDATFTDRQGQPFTGDLAITTQFNVNFSSMTFFDVTDRTAPAALSTKTLTVNADLMSGPNPGNTLFATAYAKGVAAFQTTTGVTAYAAVEKLGVMGSDVGANIPQRVVNERLREPVYSGAFTDIAGHGSLLYAVSPAAGELAVLDPNLSLIGSAGLSYVPRRVRVAQGLQTDLDGDGLISSSEVFSLAVLAGDFGISVVDVRNSSAPAEIGRIPIPGVVRDVEIDATTRRLFAIAELTTGGPTLLIADVSDPAADPTDIDDDGFDDRILWKASYPAGANGLRLDRDRGLLYIAHPGGLDIWGVYETCCNLGVDLIAPQDSMAEGKSAELFAKEKRALQHGLADALREAQAACGGVDFNQVRMFELGSGACLWTDEDPVKVCDGNYQPGVSDHDYSGFFPDAMWDVWVPAPDGTSVPKPVCVVTVMGDHFTDNNMRPKAIVVPAENDVPAYEMYFRDITFFANRLDEFRTAQYRITRTDPSIKGDVTNDLALGRQLLLLKHITEGRWIRVPGFEGLAEPEGGDMSFENTLTKLRDVTGVSMLEGYEWANLMEFNFMKAQGLLRIAGAADESSVMHDFYINQLHVAGKAGIRTALARLIGDPAGNQRTLDIVRSGDPLLVGVDPNKQPGGRRTTLVFEKNACLYVDRLSIPEEWETKPCNSLEEYMASAAAWTLRPYGPSGLQQGPPEPPLSIFTLDEVYDIYDFFQVKSDRLALTSDAAADKFMASVSNFIDKVKTETKPQYDLIANKIKCDPGVPRKACDPWFGSLELLPNGELGPGTQRDNNMKKKEAVLNGEPGKEGAVVAHVAVVPHVFNRSYRDALDVALTMTHTRAAGNVETKTTRLDLEGGDHQYPEWELGEDGKPRLEKKKKVPLFELKAHQVNDRNKAGTMVFTVDLPERTVAESNRADNWAGLVYYILDPKNLGSRPLNLPSAQPPVPASALLPDAECSEEPTLVVTQELEVSMRDDFLPGAPPTPMTLESPAMIALRQGATLKLTLTNPSSTAVEGATVCTSISNACFALGHLSSHESRTALVTVPTLVPAVFDSVPTAYSSSTGVATAPAFRIVVGCEEYQVVSLFPDPNPTALAPNGTPTLEGSVMRGGYAVRYFKVVRRTTGLPLKNAAVTVRVESPGYEAIISTFTTDNQGIIGIAEGVGAERKVRAGIEFAPPRTAAVGTVYTVQVVQVNGLEPQCHIPPKAEASVREREFEKGLSYGATVGGTFGLSFAIVEGSVSGEAGTGTTINKGLITTGPPSSESSGDEPLLQTSLSVGRNQFTEIGGNIGVSIGANVQLGPVKLEGNWAKLSGGGSHRETLSDAYGLPAGVLTDADKCVLSQLTLWNFLHFNPMLWKLKDLSLKEQCGKEAAEYQSDLKTEVARKATLSGEVLSLAGTLWELPGNEKTHKIDASVKGEANYESAITTGYNRLLAWDGTHATQTGFVDAYALRSTFDYRAGVEFAAKLIANEAAGQPEDDPVGNEDLPDDKKRKVEIEKVKFTANFDDLKKALRIPEVPKIPEQFTAKFDLSDSFAEQYGIEFEWDAVPGQPFPLAPKEVRITYTGRKYSGWWKPPGQDPQQLVGTPRGDRTFIFTNPYEVEMLAKRLANVDSIKKSWLIAELAANVAFAPTTLNKEYGKFLVALLETEPTFVDRDQEGSAIKIPLGATLGFKIMKVGGELGAKLTPEAEATVGYMSARGQVRGGRSFVSQRYPRKLFPDPSLADGLWDVIGAVWQWVSERHPDELNAGVGASIGPGLGADMATQTARVRIPAGASATNREVRLTSFIFDEQSGPVAEKPRRPAATSGPANEPHYGANGFHLLYPDDLRLDLPMQLELKAGAAAGAAAGLGAFKWDNEKKDWDPVPSTYDEVKEIVLVDGRDMGLYTLAPRMPSGAVTFSVTDAGIVAGPTGQVQRFEIVSGPLSLNTNEVVADGTMYTVDTRPREGNAAAYGTVVEPDADVGRDGHQVAAQGGVVRFTIDVPIVDGDYLPAVLVVWSSPGTAYGDTLLEKQERQP